MNAFIYARRCIKLAELLESLPRKRFYFGSWYQAKDEETTFSSKVFCLEKNTCGTTACALGWATTMPCAKKAGMFLRSGAVWMKGGGKPEEFFSPYDHRIFYPGWRELGSDTTPKAYAKQLRLWVESTYGYRKDSSSKRMVRARRWR